MIYADTGVWLDFFRNRATAQVELLARAIHAGDVIVGDLICTEILQGCDTDREFRLLLTLTAAFPQRTIVDATVAVDAARNYRRLRAIGVTPRKTVDTLIATRCIADGVPLLYADRDVEPFVRHLGLRPALHDTPGFN